MAILFLIAAIIAILMARSSINKTIVKLRCRRIKSQNSGQFFDQYFIEPRSFYTRIFNTIPCVAYIGNVDINKLFDLVKTNKYSKVVEVFQRIYHDWDNDKICFSKTLFVLENKIVIR